MDVTPSAKMLKAMQHLVDSTIGEAPHLMDVSAGANARRLKREMAMSILHSIVALSMREGVNRAVTEARHRQAGLIDGQDRDAVAKAVDDAQRGGTLIHLPGNAQSQH